MLVRDHWHTRDESHTDLFRQLHDLVRNVWSCRKIVIDATGLGLGLSSLLQSSLGHRVAPFIFSEKSKSNLGFELLAAINSGKLKMYAPDGSAEFARFWTEIDRAECSYRTNRTMAFGVPAAKGHDDFLMSLGLVVEAAGRYEPRSASGLKI